ncbi:MAG: hypothetical protein Q9183_003446, partial [Haloplaca sp. 2 TL-2023]
MDGNARREKQDLLVWLSPLTFWARQQDISKTRTPETGLWLLEDRFYQAWLQGQDQILWCYGMPGAGKSVLTSLVVEELCKITLEDQGTVVCIYCDYKERPRQTPINLLSSVVRQLAVSQSIGFEEIGALRKLHKDKETRPSRAEVVDLLSLYHRLPSRVFIVVDALDECNATDNTKNLLAEELPRLLPKAHFLFTSRKLGDIEQLFDGRPQLEIRASDSDIKRCIMDRVTHEPRLRKHMAADPSLLELVQDAIVRRSDGMFLLAQLHISALATKHTRRALGASIESLPIEIDETYESTLRRINDQNPDDASLAKKVLMWVIHTSRPLTLAEIQNAIAAMDLEGRTEIDDGDLPDEDIMISVCAG